MKKVDIADERIESMIKHCSPIRVEVSLHQTKDKYYIHFDGTKTYPRPEDWDSYWSGFDKYVSNILRLNGFSSGDVKIKKACYAVCFIGTLFDFLKAEK